MTQDEIIEMAKQADVWVVGQEPYQSQLEAFAKLVSQHEREACAKLCDELVSEPVCPECKAGVLYECVACSSNNYPPQRKPLTDEQIAYQKGYADAMNWKTANHLEHLPAKPVKQGTWVGLTDEEIEATAKWADKNAAPWHIEFARAIEATLKEKNYER
jgi:hypothetical protein